MAITAGQHYQFLFGTTTQFAALKAEGKVSANDLYFLTDTKQIYVGEDLYTGQLQIVDAFPEAPSQGIIYVNSATKETKIWNGSEWIVMVPPVKSDIVSAADTDLVNAKAIKDYLGEITTQAVMDVEYDSAAQKFVVTYANATTSDLLLKDLITGAAYNAETGDFTFTVANGESIVVNTPKENFLSAASFNEETHILTLTLTDGTTVPVDLKDLVDTYTVKSTSTVTLAMSESGEITADVKISDKEGNILVLDEKGLFVPEALVQSIEDSYSVALNVDGGKLSALVKTSSDAKNILTTLEDGLFVPETDLTDYYTKSEADALLANKANTTDVNAALDLKADKADVYTKEEVYTKAEVDAFTTWHAIG